MQTQDALPHQSGRLFLTDGGLETTLIFKQNIDLPLFASCDLLRTEQGRQQLEDYYKSYAQLAHINQNGFILETATWRSNPDWTERLGYSDELFEFVNRQAVSLCHKIKQEYNTATSPMIVSGCLGPRGDGYRIENKMTPEQAKQYHQRQINILKDAGAEIITAMTINYPEEAIGIVKASQEANIPVIISFTVETNGYLPTEQSLASAIEYVDQQTNGGPAYYMINCAHPSHFKNVLNAQAEWCKRIHGIRANASCKSHAELDEATELDEGNPIELGKLYSEILDILPHANILGGCCGTDNNHIHAIHQACNSKFN